MSQDTGPLSDAIAELTASAQAYETNAPIYADAGDHENADRASRYAGSCRLAIGLLCEHGKLLVPQSNAVSATEGSASS